ncbi:MAG: InlB B-repeat-containing protein [Patescibacteria group bacterium]|nr:InlB B-repeat-containing protein [Patescibacteria group bacterium]
MFKDKIFFGKKAFTLIELLTVIFVIALIASVAFFSISNSRQKGNDIKRISDITQIQIALENYNRIEGRYPDQLISGQPLIGSSSGIIFMNEVPTNSSYNDMDCPFDGYNYSYNEGLESYDLSFCLENPVENYSTGIKCATVSGISDGLCSMVSLSLVYSAGSGGSISGSSSQSVDYGGSGSAVSAVPNTGYSFVKWSDDSTDNPRTDTNVTGNISVTAEFTANQYTLTYSAGSGGSISGSSPQNVSYGTNGSAVSAVPNTGYNFVKWSDDSTDNPRTDTNVTGNISVTAEFTANQYTLTYSAGSGGSISGSSPQNVNHGSSGSAVSAVPNTGYSFVKWSDDSTDNPRTDTNVTGNISVTAEFATNQYTLTYSAGSGGSISGSSPQTVDYGDSGSAVSAVPNTGYSFVKWSDDSTDNPRTDTNVTENISVTAEFTINQYTLTYSAGSGGSISGSSPQNVSYGSSGSAVSAVPNTGYNFVKWSDDSTDNPRTDTNVTGNISVTAEFTANQYTLTYSAGSGGSISGSSPQTVDYGSSGSAVSAVPNTGYSFVKWSDDSTDNPRTDTNITGDVSVTAEFTISQYTLTYSAGSGGSISGSSPQTVNHGSNGSVVSAVPNTGYNFVKWSDDSTDNPRTDTNVTGNISVTAEFVADQYTLTYSAGPNGSISGSSPQTVNHGSSGSAVSAVPNTGYSFVKWSDDSTSNPRTDTNVTGNISVTAEFTINQYTLTYSAGSGGSISGSSPQTVNHGGSGSQVTAVPDSDYKFNKWSDNVTSASRTDTNVTANKTVTASFDYNGASCAFVYSWDGEKYYPEHAISDFAVHNLYEYPTYGVLNKLKKVDNYYQLGIWERIPEVQYLDNVELWKIYHPQNTFIVAEQTSGKIYSIKEKVYPKSALNSKGTSYLSEIGAKDNKYWVTDMNDFDFINPIFLDDFYLEFDLSNREEESFNLVVRAKDSGFLSFNWSNMVTLSEGGNKKRYENLNLKIFNAVEKIFGKKALKNDENKIMEKLSKAGVFKFACKLGMKSFCELEEFINLSDYVAENAFFRIYQEIDGEYQLVDNLMFGNAYFYQEWAIPLTIEKGKPLKLRLTTAPYTHQIDEVYIGLSEEGENYVKKIKGEVVETNLDKNLVEINSLLQERDYNYLEMDQNYYALFDFYDDEVDSVDDGYTYSMMLYANAYSESYSFNDQDDFYSEQNPELLESIINNKGLERKLYLRHFYEINKLKTCIPPVYKIGDISTELETCSND